MKVSVVSSSCFTMKEYCFAAGLALFLSAGFAPAQIIADDDASAYFKTANWTNGANLGFGFTPWVLATNVFSGGGYRGWYLNNGYAIASATNVSGAAYTNCSWGIYANGSAPAGGNRTVAGRGFVNSLTTNVTFKLQWMSEGIGSAATNFGGFVLRNGNTTSGTCSYETGYRFEFIYTGGGTDSYLVKDGSGTVSVGVPFAAGYGNSAGSHLNATGLNCEFTLEPNDTYRFVVRSATNNEALAFLDGRPLTGTGGSTIDSVVLVANETIGSGSGGGDQNYNRMQIVSTTLIPPVISNIQPLNGSMFVNPGTNVSFEVDSSGPFLSSTNVTLLLDNVPQTLVFNTNGITSQLLATNVAPLATNVQYSAVIIAVDGNGNSATNRFSFDTTQTNSLWRDVMNYGATGNGTTLDTAAIQAAINACPSNGFVWLHNGIFLSGTIFLTNNLTLYIDPTATLLGSGSPTNYPILNPPANNSQQADCDMALVYAQSCSNVTITGGGTINGNGRNYFTSGVEATRPISIWTALCDQVTIQNINVVDAAMWTVVNMQSDDLTISNLMVNDDGLNGNRDGCDVVDCWRVLIANCTIDSGDDSICLKSGNSRGINDLLVKNCTITRSQSNGLKFGTASTGTFTNVTFQDCTVLNTAHSAMAVESVDGGTIADVTYQNITFSGCQNGIFVLLGTRRPGGAAAGSINGITFRNITGSNMTDTRGCPIFGEMTNGVTYRLQNILFDNVNISFAGGLGSIPSNPPEYAGQYPENTDWGNLPAYGYYLMHANNVTFTNCFTSAALTDARPWIGTNDVSNLTIFGPTLNIASGTGNLVLQWNKGFTLQTATNILGTYADLIGASGLYTNQFTNSLQQFFRLRQ
jgi:polygalacturonase